MARKTPRFDPHVRVLSRFYETLILLSLIGSVQGPHLAINHDPSSLSATRRRFLRNLAFVCDFDKGGRSTSAIAVEEDVNCYRFWLASNEGADDRVAEFLASVLEKLRHIVGLPLDEREGHEAEFAERCANFSSLRLRKETRILENTARRCRTFAEADPTHYDTSLVNWLGHFEHKPGQSRFAVCQAAYQARNDLQMHTAQIFSQGFDDDTSTTEARMAFRHLRHLIGRLAAHVRVPQQLVRDGARLEKLLAVYAVARVEAPVCVPLPAADAHTNLDGILKRILRKGEADPRYGELRDYLGRMDNQLRLQDAILRRYNDKSVNPLVHAEVQVLELFSREQLKFVAGERYIAASKPACLCCKLYFRYHPLRCAQLDSHEKVYPSWGPIYLPNGAKDQGWLCQRDILNNMKHDIGEAVLDKIQQLSAASKYQAASLSQITHSDDETVQGYYSDGSDGSDTSEHPVDASYTTEEWESDSDGGATL